MKIQLQLNAMLAENQYSNARFSDFKSSPSISEYPISLAGIQGVILVKNMPSSPPRWQDFIQSATTTTIDLHNRSSSAAILLKIDKNIIAYTFGYGRFLLNEYFFESDFGIKTALNTLQHDGIKSIDLLNISDQAMQKRAQSAKSHTADQFGIDISRDILRAVTGKPLAGIRFKNIKGGGSVYSFSTKADASDLATISQDIIRYYNNSNYKSNFSWMDNIKKVKNQNTISMLEQLLLKEINSKNTSVLLTLPEIQSWDSIDGFSFTRKKRSIKHSLEIDDYYATIQPGNTQSISNLKSDKIYCHDINGGERYYSIAKSIYYETTPSNNSYILFSGDWYEIDHAFHNSIDATINAIPLSSIQFPAPTISIVNGKTVIENEGAYNAKVAALLGAELLDKKLIKTPSMASALEVCDILMTTGEYIHVKHGKGGSSSLSHLFAQGYVSALVMCQEQAARQEAVNQISNPANKNIIHVTNYNPQNHKVVYLVLGKSKNISTSKMLPFFSKVNLAIAKKNLSSMNYPVEIKFV
ncbi:DUF6119 family protein [Chromobacterium vaccinii]|uniref:DUF6119 family protein n=1 Tax=Chromobacterium vaccinii TaxID=1108595 RepID=A0ABV0FLA0_9NEIS